MNSTFFIEQEIFIKNVPTTIAESWFIPIDIFMIICSTLVIILAIFFLFIIVSDKTCRTIPMVLVANSCVIAVVWGSVLLSFCLFTLRNDIKNIESQDSLCVFRAYIGYVSYALFNFSFLLQAVYRYVIVVYPTRLLYRSVRFHILAICVTCIFSFVYAAPFVLTGGILYNVDNQICQLPLRLSFFIIYGAYCAYILPISSIIFIYWKLVRYVREIGKHVTVGNALIRARKELTIVRRTVVTVTILIAVCFPYTLIMFMSFFTTPPKYHFRIVYVFVNSSVLLVMIALFQLIHPLKTSLMKRLKRRPNLVVARML